MLCKDAVMKILITLFAVVLSSAVFSQTLDDDWMFSVGDSSSIERIEINTLIDPGSAGIDVTWDFSTIGVNASLTDYSVHFTEADNFSANSLSPFANLATLSTDGSSSRIRYFDFADNSLLYIGDSTFTGSKRVFDPPVTQFSFPWEFDQVITSYSIVNNFDNFGELAFDTYIEVSRQFDGIGTLIISVDTFRNCIRIKEESISQPQSPTPLVYETYSWYYNKLSNEVARISIQRPLNRSFLEWQTNLNQIVTNTQVTPQEEPVVQYLGNNVFQTKDIAGLFSVTVFDISGRQIERKTVEFNQDGTHFRLDNFHQSTNMFFLLFVNIKTNDFFIHKYIP